MLRRVGCRARALASLFLVGIASVRTSGELTVHSHKDAERRDDALSGVRIRIDVARTDTAYGVGAVTARASLADARECRQPRPDRKVRSGPDTPENLRAPGHAVAAACSSNCTYGLLRDRQQQPVLQVVFVRIPVHPAEHPALPESDHVADLPRRWPPARLPGDRAPRAVPPRDLCGRADAVTRKEHGIDAIKIGASICSGVQAHGLCVRAHCPKGSVPGGFPRRPGDQDAPWVTSHPLRRFRAGQERATGSAHAGAPTRRSMRVRNSAMDAGASGY